MGKIKWSNDLKARKTLREIYEDESSLANLTGKGRDIENTMCKNLSAIHTQKKSISHSTEQERKL